LLRASTMSDPGSDFNTVARNIIQMYIERHQMDVGEVDLTVESEEEYRASERFILNNLLFSTRFEKTVQRIGLYLWFSLFLLLRRI